MNSIMKNRYKFLTGLILLFALSCEQIDETFDIEGTAGNPYVRFITTADTITRQEGQNYAAIINLSHALGEDVRVDFEIESLTNSLGNQAENPEDYTVDAEEFSGTSGHIIINYNFDVELTDRDTIFFDFPTDGVTDGDKIILVKIVGATALSSGRTIDFGAPGQKAVLPIKIQDVDCASDLDGTYDSGNSCFDTDSSVPTWAKVDGTIGTYNVSDFTGGWYAFAGAPQIAAVVVDACGNLSIADFEAAGGVLSFVNMSGSVLDNGSMVLTWTEANGFGNGGTPVTCTTTWTPQ